MARIRTVKPELFSSSTLAQVDVQARLLFIAMFTFADDAGRLLDIPRQILGNCFPHDEGISSEDINEWLEQLVEIGAIRRYKASGKNCIDFPEWISHQKISHPGTSHIPEWTDSGESPEDYQRPSGGLPETFQRITRESPESLRTDLGSRIVGSRIVGSCAEKSENLESSEIEPVQTAIAVKRDYLFEAVAEVCGINIQRLSPQSRGPLNNSVKNLREAGFDANDIENLAAEYHRLFPKASLTPSALAKHAAQLCGGGGRPKDILYEIAARLQEVGR